MRNRILVIPVVEDLEAFGRLAAHLGHYFAHVRPERITVLLAPSLLEAAGAWLDAPALPPAFDDRVAPRIQAVRASIALTSWPADIESLGVAHDLVLDWDVERSATEPWAAIAAGYRVDRTLFKVDWQRIRLGAASIAEAAKVLAQGRAFDRSETKRMSDLGTRLGRAQRAYLVGTGPSARAALDQDLSDGVRIACNTIVLDDELMDHVRPHVLAFADPIFHFGPSTYAARFQQALLEQARKHDFTVVTIERYAPLLRAHAPEIAERVIGLRLGAAGWPDNFDLLAHAAVRSYPNVLTLLMLPIAASVSRWIGLIGFDGRQPDDDYFWRHGPTVQLDEELRDIRQVHPGFFEVDYADYYAEHIATLDRLLGQLEARGMEIQALAESFIPALRRRSPLRPAEASAGTPGSSATLVSLTPDWIGDFGHFGPFERRVHEAAEAAGHAHVALASAGLRGAADWQVPMFSEPTFASWAAGGFPPVGERFDGELRAAVNQLRFEPGSVVYLYTADVWHLATILAVAADHPALGFVVNLMRSHGWIDRALHAPDPWIESLVDLLRSCLIRASGTNVVVTVDTDALARDVELLTGQPVRIWPMIAVSRPSQAVTERNPDGEAMHIVSPVQAQSAKGFAELVALAEHVAERLERGELRLTARWPAGVGLGLDRLAERLEERSVRLVRDNLTDEGFAELVASADVALIPYRVRPFRTRTSAVAVDALLAGKPVVAVRGTWAGDLIERHGAGLTYTEGSVTEMEGALSQVLNRIGEYRRRVAEVRATVEAEHAPERLIEFLRTAGATTASSPGARGEIGGRLGQTMDWMRRVHRWRALEEETTRFAGVIRSDDQQRTIDTWRDEVDSLKRGIRWRDRVKPKADRAAQRPQVSGPRPRARRSVRRRRDIRRAVQRALRFVVLGSVLLAVLAGGLAFAGYELPAMLALAAAVVLSTTGPLIVATRMKRRESRRARRRSPG